MKSIFDSVIKRGGYDLIGLIKRIDAYHIEGKLTDEERDELYASARSGAQMGDSVIVLEKLQDLDRRVKALEDKAVTGGETDSEADEYPEYVAGKWYYAGDKITFGGEKYICSAPEGQVCTWSPAEYPTFWQKVTE